MGQSLIPRGVGGMSGMSVSWRHAARVGATAVAAVAGLFLAPSLLRTPEPPPLDPDIGLPQVAQARPVAVEPRRRPGRVREKPEPEPEGEPKPRPEQREEPNPKPQQEREPDPRPQPAADPPPPPASAPTPAPAPAPSPTYVPPPSAPAPTEPPPGVKQFGP